MDKDEHRLECLKLAQQVEGDRAADKTVNRARAYYDFISGKEDGRIVQLAKGFAENVAATQTFADT